MEAPGYSLRNIVFLTKRLRKQLWSMVESQAALEGVTALQWSVLSGIAYGQGGSLSDLALAFDHDPGALSRSVHQLIEKGYLDYAPGVDDRRRIRLQLTMVGKRLFESLKERVQRASAVVSGSLTEDELCQLEGLLAKANLAIQDAARPAT